jgi:hypothetical protein
LSLLKKVNQKATAGSVARRALVTGVVGAIIGMAVIVRDGQPLSAPRTIGLSLWVVLCMIVGAVFEWQVPDDDPDCGDTE